MNSIQASGQILKVYQTGDRPVLVLCSDGYHYICKYKAPGGSANKLAYELIGSYFAKKWGLQTPVVSFIANDPIIWEGAAVSHDLVAPLFGSRLMESVFDLNDINCDQVKIYNATFKDIIEIALFDLWIANEDRTCNNYNLLYSLRRNRVISIDYGGIFNSGILDNSLFQLNENDSILNSDLYERLRGDLVFDLGPFKERFLKKISLCKEGAGYIITAIPPEWNVSIQKLHSKLNELFDRSWIDETWNSFVNIIRK